MTKIEEIEKQVGSNTFCILPWIHLSTRPGGTVRTCCTSNASSVGPTNDKTHGGQVGLLKDEFGHPENLNDKTFLELWNNTYMKNVRLKMLAGEQPASCIKCYKEEKTGHRSKRQWETEYWSKRVDIKELLSETNTNGSVPPKLRYVDLRLGSKCQLACIMCSPHDSSGWIKEWKSVYPSIENEVLQDTMQWNKMGNDSHYNWHKNNPKFWEEFYEQIPYFKQVYFAGGESTIIKEHYEILNKIIEMGYANQIELRYNSNGLELPDKLFKLWSHFKLVRFHFSIDDIHERNDYIRYPSRWETIERNLDLLDNSDDNIEVTIACAVQLLNIFYIPDFIKWKLLKKYKKINPWPLGAGMLNYHFVYWPPHLNIKVLPRNFKEECHKKYEEFYIWLEENWQLSNAPSKEEFLNSNYGIMRLRGMINFMKSEDWSIRLPESNEYITKMDKIRNTNFFQTFPEMKEIFNDY